ncbi:hypothetical protein CO683_04750 [Bradyrhizobium ottawaense]|uniref:Uncharacterized protein n=1 Tax=Bradyrhizobium ottawaense TaxID=931866 RepID=A0A2U8P4K7_9BRAD|nr:hypothetical protein CIT37_10845 [Bradyrhizobium ottawaense]PDT71074.1 hypothetical protein CO683_04750 [Bradyrhizobium ottawaense]BBO09213.1 hypothetical protein TM102_06830 [Bradyrhizobium sp. TM102]GMO62039.1 hypothetical protein BwSG20_18090 [Bradyrhizobium ottawaense]
MQRHLAGDEDVAVAGKNGALPPPLAGKGWGEGVSAGENPQEDRTLTRRSRLAPRPKQNGPPEIRTGR